MLQRTRLVACAFTVLALLAVTAPPAAASGAPPSSTPVPAQVSAPPYVGEVLLGQYWRAVVISDYTHAVQMAHVTDYVNAVAAAQAAEADQARRTLPANRPAPAQGNVGGGACGGATNGADAFIQRESGGNPQVFNPSGAYGCYQIMPGTWAGAGCNELGQYGNASPAAQAACASRLSLSAWNASGPTG